MTKNEILDYLGIEEENRQRFWKENKIDIKKCEEYRKKYNYEYIMADDFGIYTPKTAKSMGRAGNFIIYEEV